MPLASLARALTLALLGAPWCTAHLEFYILHDTVNAKLTPTPVFKTPGANPRVAIRSRSGNQFANDNARKPNVPVPGGTCHGLPRRTENELIAEVKAGAAIELALSDGGDHDGGHCAFFVSTDMQDSKWYKFQDALDCTLGRKKKSLLERMRVPLGAPLGCKDGCTIMVAWSPLHTGKFETYTQCFDVIIPNAKGGMEVDYPVVPTPFANIRPNLDTGKTSAFGPYIYTDGDGKMIQEQVVDGDQQCYKYTVRNNDTYIEVRIKFDFKEEAGKKLLYEQNRDVMPDIKTLPPAGTELCIVGDCCSASKSSVTARGLSVAAAVVAALGVALWM